MKIANYDPDLTDAQWAYLQPMLPKISNCGRPPKDRRRLIDAVLYLVKCGRFMRHRRLGRDYETTDASAQAWISIAMIRLQLRRLA